MATKQKDVPTMARNTNSRRIRKIFGNIHEISEMPNLIEVQRESYEQFLRSDPAVGYVSGLEKTLRSVFPIQDFAGTAHLDFDHYELEPPKYDTDECRQRGLTYAAPMRVTLRLTTFEIDPDTEAKSVIDIKEQDVYMGDMPLMTRNGTFIINGTERVIVSQMHRSPGVLFDHDRGKTHASGKYLFAARVIPYRGSWLDFEFDAKDIVNVRIDRKRKLPVTALLHALGLSSEEILNTFYNRITYRRGKNGWQIPYAAEGWRGQKPTHDVVDADTGEIMSPLAAFLTHAALEAGDNQAQAGQDAIQLMSVHAAKGLEFDQVFITGLEEGLFPHENSATDPDGLEEERRLAYVAITRARKRLYLSFSQTRMLHGQTRYNLKSRFFDELPEGALRWLTPRNQGFGSGFARDYQAAWQRGSGLGSMVGAGRVEPREAPAAFEAAARTTPQGLRSGQSVFHTKFGEGVIVTLEGTGADARAQVNFGRHGMKWLALSVAKLTPVE